LEVTVENSKVDLNKTEFNSEEELRVYLLALVLDFTSKVNALDKEFFGKGEDPFPEFKEKYIALFDKYCTEKRRAKGSRVNSIFSSGRYTETEKSLVKIEFITEDSAELYFKTEYLPYDSVFVIKRREGIWRIYKYRHLRWKNGRL
jgi:hypothetical protein